MPTSMTEHQTLPYSSEALHTSQATYESAQLQNTIHQQDPYQTQGSQHQHPFNDQHRGLPSTPSKILPRGKVKDVENIPSCQQKKNLSHPSEPPAAGRQHGGPPRSSQAHGFFKVSLLPNSPLFTPVGRKRTPGWKSRLQVILTPRQTARLGEAASEKKTLERTQHPAQKKTFLSQADAATCHLPPENRYRHPPSPGQACPRKRQVACLSLQRRPNASRDIPPRQVLLWSVGVHETRKRGVSLPSVHLGLDPLTASWNHVGTWNPSLQGRSSPGSSRLEQSRPSRELLVTRPSSQARNRHVPPARSRSSVARSLNAVGLVVSPGVTYLTVLTRAVHRVSQTQITDPQNFTCVGVVVGLAS